MQISAVEYDPATGRAVPLTEAQLRNETAGWTEPPVPLARPRRRRWVAYRKELLEQGTPPELAWYWANRRYCS